jgi:hypothetical protein
MTKIRRGLWEARNTVAAGAYERYRSEVKQEAITLSGSKLNIEALDVFFKGAEQLDLVSIVGIILITDGACGCTTAHQICLTQLLDDTPGVTGRMNSHKALGAVGVTELEVAKAETHGKPLHVGHLGAAGVDIVQHTTRERLHGDKFTSSAHGHPISTGPSASAHRLPTAVFAGEAQVTLTLPLPGSFHAHTVPGALLIFAVIDAERLLRFVGYGNTKTGLPPGRRTHDNNGARIGHW